MSRNSFSVQQITQWRIPRTSDALRPQYIILEYYVIRPTISWSKKVRKRQFFRKRGNLAIRKIIRWIDRKFTTFGRNLNFHLNELAIIQVNDKPFSEEAHHDTMQFQYFSKWKKASENIYFEGSQFYANLFTIDVI